MTGGIEAALEQARAPAGDKKVGLWGGADIIRQYLEAELLDELNIHIAPVTARGQVRPFEGLDPDGIELRMTGCVDTPGATHLRLDVVK